VHVGIPNTVGEQAIQIGKVWIAVAVEAQAFKLAISKGLGLRHLKMTGHD
jgi:hypothetical protein